MSARERSVVLLFSLSLECVCVFKLGIALTEWLGTNALVRQAFPSLSLGF